MKGEKIKGHIRELENFVAERNAKIVPSEVDDRYYVALEHIGSGSSRLLGWSRADTAKSAKTMFKKNDVLFGKLRPNLRKCVKAPFEGVSSTDILVLRPRANICDAFLPHLMRSERVMAFATRTATGTKMPRTSWASLSRFPVSMPSKVDQEQIALFLDSIDDNIEFTRLLVEQTRRLKAAVAQDLLINAVREKRFPVAQSRLGNLFAERNEKGRPGLPTMAITMNDGIMDREDMDRRIESALTPEEHLLACKGDLAYNMMRMWQGVSGLVPQDSLISPAYVVVTPTPAIDPEFAAHLFKLPEMIRLFHRYSQGLTNDRLRLYYHQFAEIPVTLPKNKADQQRIARLLTQLEQTAQAQETRLAQLQRTKSAISNQIFSHV